MGNARRLTVVSLIPVLLAGACGRSAEPPAPEAAAQESVALEQGWTRLPDPPEARAGAYLVWAGARLLLWGGCDPTVQNSCRDTADGFVFDPVEREWTALPSASEGGAHGSAVWTGDEALFFNRADGEGHRAQAYDPVAQSWRTTASSPEAGPAGVVHVWTGDEVVVWGGGDDPAAGAAYDPRTDSWRSIADAPRALNAASAVWTGAEVLVFGSNLNGRNIADTETSVGLAYDPATDRWESLPPSDLSPQATSAAWTGDEMVAWDYEVRWQSYDPVGDSWVEEQKMPLQFSECYPDSARLGDRVFGFFCGTAALYEDRSWERVTGGPLAERLSNDGRQIELWRFADMASGGGAVFMLLEGITTDPDGVVCYGCPGSPNSFWAYRPPA